MAQADIYDFESSCGVQSERLGPGPGCFGSGGIPLLQLVVCRESFFFFSIACEFLGQMTNVFLS